MAFGQERLPLDGLGDAPQDIPLIYIASALSTLADEEKRTLDAWCKLIDIVVTETANESQQRWLLRVHAPIAWSAPSDADGRSPAEIYDLNFRHVLSAAALICIGLRGGSFGAGQEFGWACLLGLPVLYLAPEGENVSRQIEGTPADVEVQRFGSSDELQDAVRVFLRGRRQVIESQRWRQGDDVQLMLTPLVEALRMRWSSLKDAQRDAVVAESRVARRRIEHLVSDPPALRAASVSEIASLAGALQISPWRTLAPGQLPDLDSRQVAALELAADEYGWPARDLLFLHQEARLEMARGGVRRFPLTTTEEWLRFREKFST